MKAMRCGTFGFRQPALYQAPTGEMYGANIAELGLARETLRVRDGLQLDLWSQVLHSSLSGAQAVDQQQLRYKELKREFGERIRLRPLSELRNVATEENYVFLCSTHTFSAISDLRSQIAASTMPICSLTHSLLAQDLQLGYKLLFTAQPGDVTVVSSLAGKTALEHFIGSARERVSCCTGTQESVLRMPTIVHLPFGVQIPNQEALDGTGARTLFRVPTEAFVVLYFGRLSQEYKADLDPIIQALYWLRRDGINAWLMVAGQATDASYVRHLERRCAALGLDTCYVCLGNCPEFLKSFVYAACDVMVSPADSVQETFGLTILETMAHARPVIASDWSGYRELVTDGETGFLLDTLWTPSASDFASLAATVASPMATAHYMAQRTIMDCGQLVNRLKALAREPELRVSMGAAGRRRAIARYTWPLAARHFVDLWEEQLKLSASAHHQAPRKLFSAFEHYAQAVVEPQDYLAKLPGDSDVAQDILLQWDLSNRQAVDQMRSLMEATSDTPVSIGELCEKGFSLDCILWLAKKGIRCIVKPGNK